MKEFKWGQPLSIIKDLDTKNRIVKAYYCNYEHVDSDGDLLAKGLYNKSIRERGPGAEVERIKHLFNHWDATGKVMEVRDDDSGGWFVSKLGRHTVGNDTLLMYEDGIITEHSHGFEVVNSETKVINGEEVRVITEGVLWEVTSLDKWGAQMHTPRIKSLEQRNHWVKRVDKLVKALRGGKYSDDTFELLQIQLMQIQEMIKQFDEPEQPPHSPEPGRHSTIGLSSLKFNFKNKYDGIQI